MNKEDFYPETRTRNSWIRNQTKGIIGLSVRGLRYLAPGIQPDDLTLGALVGIVTSTIYLIRNRDDVKAGKKGVTALTVFSLSDAFDGTLARQIDAENPGSHDFKKGQRKDAASDRGQEIILGLGRAVIAWLNGDMLGATAAFSSTTSAAIPSATKAWAESQGKVVPEGGRDLLGFFGTRAGRATLGIIATSFPEIRGIPVQKITDILITAANVVTAFRRSKIALDPKAPRVLGEETIEQANIRLKDMAFFVGFGGLASLVTYAALNRLSPQPEAPLSESLIADEVYSQTLIKIEDHCVNNKLDHRFVGDAIGDLIGKQTKVEVDKGRRTVNLVDNKLPSALKDNGTFNDIEVFCFYDDMRKVRRAQKLFKSWEKKAEAMGRYFPQISIKAAEKLPRPNNSWRVKFMTKQGEAQLTCFDPIEFGNNSRYDNRNEIN